MLKWLGRSRRKVQSNYARNEMENDKNLAALGDDDEEKSKLKMKWFNTLNALPMRDFAAFLGWADSVLKLRAQRHGGRRVRHEKGFKSD